MLFETIRRVNSALHSTFKILLLCLKLIKKKMKDRKREKFCGELDRPPVVDVRRGCFTDVSVPLRACVCPLADVFTREHASIRCVPPISHVTNQTWPECVSQWKLVAERWKTDTLYKELPYYQHPLVFNPQCFPTVFVLFIVLKGAAVTLFATE